MGAEWRNAGRISPLMDSLLHSYHKRVLAMSSVFFASYLRNVVDQTPIIYIIAQLRQFNRPTPPRVSWAGWEVGAPIRPLSLAVTTPRCSMSQPGGWHRYRLPPAMFSPFHLYNAAHVPVHYAIACASPKIPPVQPEKSGPVPSA